MGWDDIIKSSVGGAILTGQRRPWGGGFWSETEMIQERQLYA